jgi:hypothetical protein
VDLDSTPHYANLKKNIIRIMKSRRMRWAGHVVLIGNIKIDLRETG